MKIRVAKVREKSLEIEKNPCQGKVREFHFQSGEFRKNGKNLGKGSGKWPKVKEKWVETAGKFEMDIYWQPWNTAFTGRKLCFSY